MQAPSLDRLSALEAADYLAVSRSTLAKWRARRCGPPFHRCGPRLVHYYRHEIDLWLQTCDRTHPYRDRQLPAAAGAGTA